VIGEKIRARAKKGGIWGAGALGMLFAFAVPSRSECARSMGQKDHRGRSPWLSGSISAGHIFWSNALAMIRPCVPQTEEER
jgi:hypothetical protein